MFTASFDLAAHLQNVARICDDPDFSRRCEIHHHHEGTT